MHVFIWSKLVGEDIDENFEVVCAFAEVLHQISQNRVQVPN